MWDTSCDLCCVVTRRPEHYLKWRRSQWLHRLIEASKDFDLWAVSARRNRMLSNERERQDSFCTRPISVGCILRISPRCMLCNSKVIVVYLGGSEMYTLTLNTGFFGGSSVIYTLQRPIPGVDGLKGTTRHGSPSSYPNTRVFTRPEAER